ncbi:DNA translocase FtsK 4TM domain-containing protein [Parahaliea sp. F7430]|uniref:DNA translocase FtsK n=1 Tax=Sediminihaliea albiluteola TaxID=2758564 RepID=A0A7W2TUV4_9GAMM|nr:DNA translocase FtsK [Sediminihaliea albiluteola]MBA6412315.1 DNA translocase FtsK 4TM domain-containing protein [Sediminihaliea albiluteola]
MPDTTSNAQSFLGPRLREGAFIGVSAVCLYLLLALFTYSPSDPGWSATGSGGKILNAGGPTGAWLADVTFSLVGFAAYLFPLLLAYRAVVIFIQRHEGRPFDWVTIGIRSLGLVLVMIAGTALAAMNDSGSSGLPQGAGGILGQAIGDAFTLAFNHIGSRLILLAVFLFGMTIFTDLSWLGLMDRLGAWTLRLIKRCRDATVAFVDRLRDRREREKALEARKIKIEQHVEKEKKRKPPKIKPLKPKPEPSERVQKEKQQPLFDVPVSGELPPLELLDEANHDNDKGFSKEALESMSKLLELKLLDFGVKAEVVAVYPGPVITRFEIQPAAGVKVSRISNLAKDLARSLAVISVRVVEVIPGKPVVGIEIPNEHREIVNFREVLSSKAFDQSRSPLTLALGHDISGEPVVADLSKMPHLLVAGTTGSGKSVGVNAMLLSLLYKSTPADVRLILVDPKMLELSVYDGIPHLLTPVITDMKDAANGLRWCVAEMERRYKLMAALGVRNLAGYNRKVLDAEKQGEPIPDPLWSPDPIYAETDEEQTAPSLDKLPSIVVVIDEFADMMMIVGKKVEELIARIAQKARAAGIHLILATQRPSVDVITGLIKANIPTRIAFQVSSKVDSRTILDQGGAEQLLGHGDMLYLPPGSGLPNRVHGAFCSDEEVHRVVADWQKRAEPMYIEGLLDEGSSTPVTAGELQAGASADDEEHDALYDEAVYYVTQSRRASISSVQRKLRVGYNRAARLIEAMEMAGVVTEMGTNGQREVLAPPPPE